MRSATLTSTIAIAPWLDFELPPELEAHEPPEARGLPRDGVRLMVSFREDDRIVHARFVDLPRFLRPNDLLVVNDSATVPAALPAQRPNGSTIPFHLSTRLPGGLWLVEPRDGGGQDGETLSLPSGGTARLLIPYRDSARLWIARLDLPAPVLEYLNQWGRPITYSYVRGAWPIEMYQTVYATEPGSAEMPSAGRPFSCDLLLRLLSEGAQFASITLHAGVASLESHEPPYEEFFQVPSETVEAVRAAKAAGGRVIAVGTTVVRALESAVDARGCSIAARGWTDLVITEERGVRVINGLLTGFHEPKATHLAMLGALAGRRHVEKSYRAALDAGYLWHEFGDVHLIL